MASAFFRPLVHQLHLKTKFSACDKPPSLLHAIHTGASRHLTDSLPWKEAKALKRASIYEKEFQEEFVKGSGKGGQKINKVRNNVFLKHLPTGITVQCQKTRSLADNRRVARKLMLTKLDELIHGENSAAQQKIKKLQKKKAKKYARSQRKHAAARGQHDLDAMEHLGELQDMQQQRIEDEIEAESLEEEEEHLISMIEKHIADEMVEIEDEKQVFSPTSLSRRFRKVRQDTKAKAPVYADPPDEIDLNLYDLKDDDLDHDVADDFVEDYIDDEFGGEIIDISDESQVSLQDIFQEDDVNPRK